jgi:hypothetical protein
MSNLPTLKIDSNGFIQANGAKICRLDTAKQTLLFLDRNRLRAEIRGGSNEIEIPIASLVQLITQSPTPPGCSPPPAGSSPPAD